MFYSSILLGLLATASTVSAQKTKSGVDIWMHQEKDCHGKASALWKDVDIHANQCFVLPDNHFGADKAKKPAESIQLVVKKVEPIDFYGYNREGANGKPMCREGGRVNPAYPGSAWAYPQGEIHLRAGGKKSNCENAPNGKAPGSFAEDEHGFRSLMVFASVLERRAATKPCKRGPLPDFMVFEGEAHYNLTGLNEEDISKISDLHTSGAELPEEIKRRMVSLEEIMA